LSLRRHTLWNLAGNALPLLAGVFFIPYCLKELGYEAFGVLTLIWSLIGYFSLFDLGVGRALTYEISHLIKGEKSQEIPNALYAGLALTVVTGAIGGLLIYLLAHPLASSWLKIAPALQADTQFAFEIAGLGIIFTTLTSGLRGAQEALGNFGFANVNKIFLGTCMFCLPAAAVWMHGPHLWVITIYLLLARVVVFLMSCLQLRVYLFTKIEVQKMAHLIKPLLSFGGWVSVSGVVGPLMIYGDRFFVGTLVGSALLPIYAVPQEALQRLLMFPVAFTGALLPKIVGVDQAELKSRYRQSIWRMTWFMLPVCLLAAGLAHPVLAWWISPDFANAALPIALILSIGIWLNSIATIPYTFLHGVGSTKSTALIHLFELGIYFALLYFLVQLFGLSGAALAWTLRVGLDLVLLKIAVKQYID
jgi:O-antigen/teichoic acid export membrane protein